MFARYRPPRRDRHQKPPTLQAEGEAHPIGSPSLSDRPPRPQRPTQNAQNRPTDERNPYKRINTPTRSRSPQKCPFFQIARRDHAAARGSGARSCSKLFLKPATVDISRLVKVHRQMSIILMQKQVDTCMIWAYNLKCQQGYTCTEERRERRKG